MAQILVRGLSDDVVKRLRARAADSHRSLEAEVREILERESRKLAWQEARRRIDEIMAPYEGQVFPDSTPGIAEDRLR